MFSFNYLYFVIFTIIVWRIEAEISDKRLCIDELCSVVISDGKTLRKYNSIEPDRLSFLPNQDVRVFSYGAGVHPELWGVEINGKRGYVDKQFIRETNLVKRPKLLVDTELGKVPSSQEIVPEKTQSDFDIVDGTKIPLDLVDLTTTENVLQSTESTPPLDTSPIVRVQPTADEEDDEDDDDEGDDDDEDDEASVEEESVEDPAAAIPAKESLQPPTPQFIETPSETVTVTTDLPNNPGALPIFNDVPVTPDPAELKIEEKVQKTPLQIDSQEDGVNETFFSGEKRKLVEEVPQNIVQESPPQDPVPVIPPQKVLPDIPPPSQNPVPDVHPQKEFPDIPPSAQDPVLDVPSPPQIPVPVIHPQKVFPDLPPPSQNPVPDVPAPPQNLVLDVHSQEEFPDVPSPSQNPVPDVLAPSQNPVPLVHPQNVFPDVPPQNILPVVPELNKIPQTAAPEAHQNLVPDVSSQSIVAEASQNVVPDLPSQNTLPEVLEKSSHDVPPQTIIPEVSSSNIIPEEPSQNLISENVEPSIKTDEPKKVEPAAPSGFFGLGGLFKSNPEKAEDPLEEVAEQTTAIDDVVEPITGTPEVPEVIEQTTEVPEEAIQATEVPAMIELTTEISEEVEEATGVSPVTGIPEVLEQKWYDPDIAETVAASKEDQVESPSATDANEDAGGFFSNIMSFFSTAVEEPEVAADVQSPVEIPTEKVDSYEWPSTADGANGHCDGALDSCDKIVDVDMGMEQENESKSETRRSVSSDELQDLLLESFNSDIFAYLVTTALSVIILLFIWTLMDKCRREQPLIARINKLEQQLLATYKENEILQEQTSNPVEIVDSGISSELHNQLLSQIEELSLSKKSLEEQIQALEKELDMSTEMGIELNKMISEMLQSSDGSEILKENMEQMQRKLLDQQSVIDGLNDMACLKDTENLEVRLELEVTVKKVADLQGEVDKMVQKLLKIEEERTLQQHNLEKELQLYQTKCQEALTQEHVLRNEINTLKQKVAELQRLSDTKIKEYTTLKETLSSIKSLKNDKDTLKSFLDFSEIRAQLEQMKSENLKYSEQLQSEREQNLAYATQLQNTAHELKELKAKYEKADKEKVEISTKLDVLNNYFKEKEDQMQKEISKYESLWAVKEGEATSTTERIRLLQEELQNFKTQNESLKQEIVNQEVELRSQISILEKKSHENWVTNRQTERRLEEARQEAALLRNRLTLRERSLQSPIQNGEHPLSPLPLESPPPIFNPRDLVKSSPIPGLPPPPPFLPHLGSAPFMPLPPLEGMLPPPPNGMPPPFMPFPGDRRPPPLGGRYSPESTVYSEYDRYSPPSDSEYGASPPPMRAYSPYNDRRHPKSNGRSSKGMYSSGSENDSLGKRNKKGQRKV